MAEFFILIQRFSVLAPNMSTLYASSSAPVITPGHVSQIERLMDLDERSEADWRKIQLHLDSLHKLISTSLYERKTFTNKERGGLTIILNLLKVCNFTKFDFYTLLYSTPLLFAEV